MVLRIPQPLGPGLLPGRAEGIGLGLAPALRHGLGEVGEEYGEPEPEGELEREGQVTLAGHDVSGQHERRDRTPHQHDEHDRIPHHVARVQLVHRFVQSPPDDRRVEQRVLLHGHGGSSPACERGPRFGRSGPLLRGRTGEGAVQRDVQQEHVDPRISQEAELASLGVLAHERPHRFRLGTPLTGHPRRSGARRWRGRCAGPGRRRTPSPCPRESCPSRRHPPS